MDSVLTASPLSEPTPEEIAQMQAEMQEIWTEIKASNVRAGANRVEINQLRAETQVMLDSIKRMLSN